MNADPWPLFNIFGFFITMVFICGLYCILATRSIIRVIIGWELLIKAVTLLMVLTGYITGQTALTQCLVITIIVIEVIVAVVAGGIALRIFGYNDNLDVRKLTNLRG